MPIKVLSAPSWTEATESLERAIASAQSVSPLDPVTVLTPTARSAVGVRREIVTRRGLSGGPSGLANVRFMVLARFAETLGAAPLLQCGRRRLTRSDIGAAMHAESERRPPWLREAIDHPAGEAELVDRYEELRAAEATALGRLGAGGGRIREIAALFAAVRERTAPRCFDDVDLFASATAVASAGGARELGTVIVYLPVALRAMEADLFSAVGATGDLLVILDPDLAGHLNTDDLGELRARLTGSGSPEPPVVPLAMDGLLVAPDPAVEVREVVRLVLTRLGQGVLPERVALVHSHASPYAPLLAAELGAVGIPFSGRAPVALDSSPTSRFLLALLSFSRRSLARSVLFELLECAPAVGSSNRAEWDRCSRLAGVVDGDIAHWIGRLRSLGAAARRVLDGDQRPGGGSRRTARAQRTLDAVEGLVAFLRALEQALIGLEQARSWRSLADACVEALDRLLASAEARSLWPGWSGAADGLVVGVLAELAELDTLDGPPDVEHFRSRLELVCARPGPHVGTFGEGVAVGSLEQSVGLDLDLLVLLGASDRELPPPPQASPLFSAVDRLRAGLEVTTASAGHAEARRRAVLACGGAAEVFASYAVRSGTGGSRTASPVVSGEMTLLRTREASLDAVGRDAAVALEESERTAGELFARRGTGSRPATSEITATDPLLRRGLEFVVGRGSRRLGPFNGAVGSGGLAELVARTPFSPTSLEEYANCPSRYFLDHILDLEVVEDPERRLFIDPRDRGSIVHEVLERFVGEVMAAGADWDDRLGADRLTVIADAVFERYERAGLTGKGVLWELERRRLLRVLELERRADVGRRAAGERPVALEHGFGFGEVAPVRVEVAGRVLEFRGMIDRVDAISGGVRVVDYKTGRPDGFRPIDADPVDRGRHLQLVVYSLAAAESFGGPEVRVRADYRFLGNHPEEVGIDFDPDKLGRFAEVADVLVTSIDAGLFPVRPGEPAFDGYANCRFCDFNEICPADRGERWQEARSESALDRYRVLVEGEPPLTAPGQSNA